MDNIFNLLSGSARLNKIKKYPKVTTNPSKSLETIKTIMGGDGGGKNRKKKCLKRERMMSDASWDGEGVMLTSSTSSLSPKKEGGSRGKGRGFRKLSTPGKAPDDQPTPHQQKIIAFRRR